MYKSPIEIIYGQMETQMEGYILRAIQKYGINVDKDELVRALNYDREQYYNGYADGRNDVLADLVRCKDCKHWQPSGSCAGNSEDDLQPIGGCEWANCCRKANDFCAYGERREGE